MELDKLVTEKIGQGLVRIGALRLEQVKEILNLQKNGNKKPFGQIAVELGYVDVRKVIEYLKSKGQEYYLSGSDIGLEDN